MSETLQGQSSQARAFDGRPSRTTLDDENPPTQGIVLVRDGVVQGLADDPWVVRHVRSTGALRGLPPGEGAEPPCWRVPRSGRRSGLGWRAVRLGELRQQARVAVRG